MSKFTDKIPSFIWIIGLVAAVGLGLAVFYGGFLAVTMVEGVGSVIALAVGWIILRAGQNSTELKSQNLVIAFLIIIFAGIGIGLDQPGNFIYNKPMEWIFCPANTDLEREVVTGSARGGGVTVSQKFNCLAEIGSHVVRPVSGGEFFAYRFGQYVLLGYILLGVSRIYTKISRGMRKD